MSIGKFAILSFLLLAILHVRAENYFQQEVRYSITVKLDDKHHTLTGNETIFYKNNSDSSLHSLFFHIWANASANENTALAKEYYSRGDDDFMQMSEDEKGRMDSLDFTSKGEKLSWNLLPDSIDICQIFLTTPLLPGDSILIETPFKLIIPSDRVTRMGHTGQSYHLTQWFPKPAVFDREGWHYIVYHDNAEFFSEFGAFDVSITLPENYVVAATGQLQDETEIKFLNNLDQQTRLLTSYPTTDSFSISSNKLKTIRFKQDHIHDFAWFADKRFHYLKNEIQLPSGKKVFSHAYFLNGQSKFWLHSPTYFKDAIEFYSKSVGEYPYTDVSAIDDQNANGSEMEYPMITTIGRYETEAEFEITLLHEIGHNWFYGILGSNERLNPWMDEGVNNFMEVRYVYSKYKNDSSMQNDESPEFTLPFNTFHFSRMNHRLKLYRNYLYLASNNYDMASGLSSELYNHANYRSIAYSKPSICFDHLIHFLGDSLFDACLHEYYNRWKFKHPSPADFRNAFEYASNQNLGWFFDDLLYSTKKTDYSICSLRKNEGKYILHLSNKGETQIPITLDALIAGKIKQSYWIGNFRDTTLTVPNIDCESFVLDATHRAPEVNRKNNSIQTSGLFRKSGGISLKFGLGMDDTEKQIVFYSPIIGWNNYNKLMAGIVLHNISFFRKKFEYQFMPLFAFGSKDLAGGGKLSYHFFPKCRIYQITTSIGISRYAYEHDSYNNNDFNYSALNHFLKTDSKITFSFLPTDRVKNRAVDFTVRHIFIRKEIPYFYTYSPSTTNVNFLQLIYTNYNTNQLERCTNELELTANTKLIKLTGTVNKFFNYRSASKGLTMRLFAGYTNISDKISAGDDYRMSLSGKTGSRDYLFDEVFAGRTETSGILSQQFVASEAGIKIPTDYYRLAQKWMAGVNVSTTLPGMILFKLFLDIGTFDKANTGFDEARQFSWDAGIEVPVIKNVLTVYVPLFYSKDLHYIADQKEYKLKDLIRFEFHLKNLNPLEKISNHYRH